MKHYIAICVNTAPEKGTEVTYWEEFYFEGRDTDGKIRAKVGEFITKQLKEQEDANIHDTRTGQGTETDDRG